MARKDVGRDVARILKKLFDDKMDLSTLSKGQLEELSKVTIQEIKNSVAKGISPIEGNQRFPPYKNPKRYPGRVRSRFPKKRKRPVNLELSGDFLEHLTYRIERGGSKRGSRIRIGFYDRRSKAKEKGHREGANGQPKRPIIPSRKEGFKRRIKLAMLKEFRRSFTKNLAKKR